MLRFNRHSCKRLWSYARGLASFHLVAFVQFLSPAAAADPASRINPPEWSHRHSREELQAYGMRIEAQEPETKTRRALRLARQRHGDRSK
jgi:hypothetical protein